MRTLLAFCLVVCMSLGVAAPAVAKEKDPIAPSSKQAHYPGIPSLQQPTPQELFVTNQIIYFVVMDDVGLLKKIKFERKGSRDSFHKLGHEAVPLLVEWMNYCAERNWTCPTTILGTKTAQLLEKSRNKLDLDMLEFVNANLGKGVTIQKPPDQFTSLQALAKNFIKDTKKELNHKYKVEPFDSLMKIAAKFEDRPSTKLAEWRLMVAMMPERKNKLECFDYLIASLEKSNTPVERKELSAALGKATGIDFAPASFESLAPSVEAVNRWRAWHKESNRIDAMKEKE